MGKNLTSAFTPCITQKGLEDPFLFITGLRQLAKHPAQRLAAPHSSWSPTVKADRYSGPIFSLRRRPTGVVRVPVTAAGVSSRMVISRSFGTTLAHGLCAASSSSTVGIETSFFSLMVNARLWQRSAPTRTQRPSTGITDEVARILLVSAAFPFFAALTVIQLFVDPRDQAARQRYAKVIDRQLAAAGQRRHFALNIRDGGSRVRQLAAT